MNKIVGSDIMRLVQLLESMRKKKSAITRIPAYLEEFLSAMGKMHRDLGEAMPILVGLLPTGNLLQRRKIAHILRNAAEKGTDLSRVNAELTGYLEDGDETTRRELACALALFFSAEGKWREMETLYNHANSAVRLGVVHGMGISLTREKNDVPELVSGIAQALTDPDAEVRKAAQFGLRTAERNQRKALPGLRIFETILKKLAGEPTDEALVEILYFWVIRASGFAGAAIEVLAQHPRGPDSGNLELFEKACREILDGAHVSPCQLCRFLPRNGSFSLDGQVPTELGRLISVPETDLRKCPECGNYFVFTRTQEPLSGYDGPGFEFDINLRRLSPNETLDFLHGAALTSYQESFETLIDRQKRFLCSPCYAVREEASGNLTHYFSTLGNPAEIGKLLKSTDEAVRRGAEEKLRSLKKPGS